MQRNILSWILLAITITFTVTVAMPLVRGQSPFDLGLDLAGGVTVTYRPDFDRRLDSYADASQQEMLEIAKDTLQSRLYRSLDLVPDVVIRGDGALLVSLPGSDDGQRVLELVGRTYHLTFALVEQEFATAQGSEPTHPYQGRYLRLQESQFSGDMLDERSLRVHTDQVGSLDPAQRGATVAFRFARPHDDAFAEFTAANTGEQLAIVLDDRVEWMGVIESAIAGEGVLRGTYGLEQASDLANMLRSGSLPMTLHVESLRAVGPSLGQELQDLGWRGMCISAMLLVTLVAAAYGHRRTLVGTGLASLGVLLALLATTIAGLGLTVDLAAIAGLILSLGMGMDAFILVFEALEARTTNAANSANSPAKHRDTSQGAIRRLYSFAQEGSTLFHANATTLLVVSLLMATERLKSFALFIIVGLLASAATILITRQLLLRARNHDASLPVPNLLRRLRTHRWRLFRARHLYAVLLTLALGSAAWWQLAGPTASRLELGPEFRAATQLTLSADSETALRGAVAEFGEQHPWTSTRQQALSSEQGARLLVTLDQPLELAQEIHQPSTASQHKLTAGQVVGFFQQRGIDVGDLDSVDARLSGQRLLRSLTVLSLSFILLGIYLIWLQGPVDRFFSRLPLGPSPHQGWAFAGILLAVLTDLAVVLVALSWLGLPVGLPVVAALLTVVGYSVNDSVVLWRQIQNRWRSQGRPHQRPALLALITRSVDAITSRALLTSISTLIPAVVLLALGLEPLRGFAWVVVIGAIQGTLSSLFIVGSFALHGLSRRPVTSSETSPATVAMSS